MNSNGTQLSSRQDRMSTSASLIPFLKRVCVQLTRHSTAKRRTCLMPTLSQQIGGDGQFLTDKLICWLNPVGLSYRNLALTAKMNNTDMEREASQMWKIQDKKKKNHLDTARCGDFNFNELRDHKSTEFVHVKLGLRPHKLKWPQMIYHPVLPNDADKSFNLFFSSFVNLCKWLLHNWKDLTRHSNALRLKQSFPVFASAPQFQLL